MFKYFEKMGIVTEDKKITASIVYVAYFFHIFSTFYC